jgi:hypothetical protein
LPQQTPIGANTEQAGSTVSLWLLSPINVAIKTGSGPLVVIASFVKGFLAMATPKTQSWADGADNYAHGGKSEPVILHVALAAWLHISHSLPVSEQPQHCIT